MVYWVYGPSTVGLGVEIDLPSLLPCPPAPHSTREWPRCKPSYFFFEFGSFP